MNNIAICFLAYGDEHIEEFNRVSTELQKIKNCGEIIVCTNDSTKINTKCTIIETKEAFNYNLKRIPIKFALEKYDTILFMDTDHTFNSNINFSVLDSLEDGFYSKWKNDKVEFMGKEIVVTDTEYGRVLSQLNETKHELLFLDECIFILKSKKNKTFLMWWDDLYNKTLELNIQPNNSNPGAIEGLIMYTALLNSDIRIYDKIDFFNSFIHLGPLRLNKSYEKYIC